MENWIPMVNATIADNRSVSQRRLSCEDPDSRISYSTWRGPALMPLVTENCASCESRTWFCSSSNAEIREVHTAACAAVTTRSIREKSVIDRIAPSLNIILRQRPGACWPPSGPSPAQSKIKNPTTIKVTSKPPKMATHPLGPSNCRIGNLALSLPAKGVSTSISRFDADRTAGCKVSSASSAAAGSWVPG